MRVGRSITPRVQAKVVVLTADKAFEEAVRATFGASGQLGLDVVKGTLSSRDQIDVDGSTLVIADVDAGDEAELQALEKPHDAHRQLAAGRCRDAAALRQPLRAVSCRCGWRISLSSRCRQSSWCGPAHGPPRLPAHAEKMEAQIFTFLPAVGGAGATTLAVQTAMLLLKSGTRGKTTTCLVDLDFQHGACADYLDLEPRLNLGEIEPSPERLDRQLLEVMLSHHGSGLAVIAAPNRPAEMRSFDPDVVIRLLDLVSSHFDFVVFDMPRTWFSWTDDVLLGSNRLFIVSETTVPGLRHAKQLVEAVRERLGDGPQPQVIINRYVQKLFSSGLRLTDIKQAIGDAFVACVPNDYSLVREAIDRGVPLEEVKPGNKITTQLKKLILPQASGKAAEEAVGDGKKLKLSWARS